jgi:hypothetical protein
MWTSTTTPPPPGPWIRSCRWDLTFIIGSGVLVAAPLATYYLATILTGVPPQAFQHQQALSITMLINLAMAFLIGGPHMYATYTLTVAEQRFRDRHPWALFAATLLPIGVVLLAATRIELLITFFFGWASIHVVQQLLYLVQQYHLRAGEPSAVPRWSRAVDYVVAACCLYPVALWRMLAPSGATLALPFGITVSPGFSIGRVDLAQQLPDIVHGQVWIAVVVGALFAAAFAAFLARTAWEVIAHRVVWPRTLLLLATAPVAFVVPCVENADVALQGLNLWHSAQYLGLVHLMNAYRKQRGEMSSYALATVTGFGNGWSYYALVVVISVSAGAVMGVLHYGVGLPMLQVYYSVLLSGLFVHYLWDHAVFTQRHALAPVASS